MNPIAAETFPFTITYVTEFLRMDEKKVFDLCRQTGVQPKQDTRTGQIRFSQADLDALKQGLEGASSANTLPASSNKNLTTVSSSAPTRLDYASSLPRRNDLSRADLSLIVESVSNAKEEILKDLSHLLDDKLSGLDDVVVELIRSKSENDALREELKRLEESREQMQRELSKFKPSAFGFYRKES